MHDGELEVLNISNINSMGEIVLNDERLLTLIHQYPFLYNPHVRAYQDPDYEEWAWEQIATAFNRSYEGESQEQEIEIIFPVPKLQQRWQVLRPIISSLSRSFDLDAIPESLRHVVVKICLLLDKSVGELRERPRCRAHKLILENIDMVKRLPLGERKRLEADMMELILSMELETRGTIKMGTSEKQRVEVEYTDFLKSMCLGDLTQHQPPVKLCVQRQETIGLMVTIDRAMESSTFSYGANADEMILPDTDVVGVGDLPTAIADIKEEITVSEMSLLEPIQERHTDQTTFKKPGNYTRRCRVRLRRVNLEDYLPLAKIRRERK